MPTLIANSTQRNGTRQAARVERHAFPAADEALDRSTIAALSAGRLEQMTRDELIRVIRAAELALINKRTVERLPLLDLPTLLRLAHLAVRSCRNKGH